MAKELAEIPQKFTLSTKKIGEIDLDRIDVDLGIRECWNSLPGKIKSEKTVNYTGVKNSVKTALNYYHGLKVIELGPNSFQFTIPMEKDREKIFNGGP